MVDKKCKSINYIDFAILDNYNSVCYDCAMKLMKKPNIFRRLWNWFVRMLEVY